MALFVVASCRAYHIYKGLVVGVLHSEILGFGLTPVVLDVHLVGAGKGETVVVVGKFAGDVHPEQGEFLVVLFLVLGRGTSFEPLVVVGVDNDLEIVLQTPVHHFLDTCNPCLVNAHRHRVGDVALPTDRDSDGVETCVLHGLDGLLGHDGIAPRSFGLDTVVGHADKHRLTVLSRC